MQSVHDENLYTEADSCIMTPESIAAYIKAEQERGVSQNAIRRCRQFTSSLYDWLPIDKIITKDRLASWRKNLNDRGYAKDTVLSYIKGINKYLDHAGFSHLRFNRGRAKDIRGLQFGYLTAVESTGKKHRGDYIWRCKCKCGKEIELTATRLLTGNTLSCGCLRNEHLKDANKYFEGTSLRQSIEEKVKSERAESGFTGVILKRDKWKAYINYKGKRYSLGSYYKKEDAVKARARGKELVRLDAIGLLSFYDEIRKEYPDLPTRAAIKENAVKNICPPSKDKPKALRSNNTSGCTGVKKSGNRWYAKITYKKVTYTLGSYKEKELAIQARLMAEDMLKEDPELFVAAMANSSLTNNSYDITMMKKEKGL